MARNGRKPLGVQKEQLQRLLSNGFRDASQSLGASHVMPASFRESELNQVVSSIQRRRSVILVGPPRVGKSAIIAQLCRAVESGRELKELRGCKILHGSTAVFIGAGRGFEWQERVRALVKDVVEGGCILLYLDDLWNLRNAGRYSDRTESLATDLKPYIERGELVLIGEATPESLGGTRRLAYGGSEFALSADSSLYRLFTVVNVPELTSDQTLSVLMDYESEYGRRFGLELSPGVAERVVELTRRFQAGMALPGKAVSLLVDVVSKATGIPTPSAWDLEPEPALFTKSVHLTGGARVTLPEVMETFSQITGLPEAVFSDSYSLRHDELRQSFCQRIIGQPDAVDAVVDVVTLTKAELNDPTRPLGVLLFVGPTGSGKTLVAKVLAEYLFGNEDRMLRFDMSEYKTIDSVSNLAHSLVDQISRSGFAVVLLDEFEKAHYVAQDLFLQAFDDGRMSTPDGREGDLRNCIFIMTSNLGSDAVERKQVGFGKGGATSSAQDQKWLDACRDFFRPEMVNRIDRIVVFRHLGREELRVIARNELDQMLRRVGLERRNVVVRYQDDLLDLVALRGFDEAYGARPIKRTIRDLVLLPLSRRISAKPAAAEMLFELRVSGDEIAFVPIPLAGLVEDTGEVPPAPQKRTRKTQPRRSEEMTALLERATKLRTQLGSDLEASKSADMERERGALLARSRRPDFWENPEQAQQELSCIYHLDRQIAQSRDLLARADSLCEALEKASGKTSDAKKRGLETRLEALTTDVQLARQERNGTPEEPLKLDEVILTVEPLRLPRAGDPGEWPVVLRNMYIGWALRRGYDVEDVSVPGHKHHTLYVRGPGVASMLGFESGLHRLVTQKDPVRPGQAHNLVQLAAVSSVRLDSPATAQQLEKQGISLRETPDGSPPVRGASIPVTEALMPASDLRVQVKSKAGAHIAASYLLALQQSRPGTALSYRLVRQVHRGKVHFVKDELTGRKSHRVDEYLNGELDDFLGAGPSTQPKAP